MFENAGITAIVFATALVLTFGAAIAGRLQGGNDQSDPDLAGRKLNRWLIGLSAGATGNSGFIVTGAVGLGYTGGIQWLMLPVAWLLGDLVFWSQFPGKLNAFARSAKATTLSELVTYGMSGTAANMLRIAIAGLLCIFLGMYTSAQWLAGQKFLTAAFQLSDISALLLFSFTIVLYSAIGGFRGSVYADTLQAVISIVGCIIALAAIALAAFENYDMFLANIDAAGDTFLSLFPGYTVAGILGFVGGFAFAALGFGLGQPQIVARYLAGSSPEETLAARWIYIGFLQFTWIAMTLFGVALRGVMPGIVDAETGLSLFFARHADPITVGLVFAYVYAIIASTANSIIVSVAQSVQRDIFGVLSGSFGTVARTPFLTTFAIGLATIVLSFVLPGNVYSIAIGAVSKIGAGVAGPVIVRVLNWKHDPVSLLCSVIAGIGAAFLWEIAGYSAFFNEAGVGMIASLLVNVTLAPRR